MSALPTHARANRLDTGLLIALILGLAMAAAPLFVRVAPLAIGTLAAASAFRIFTSRSFRRLPSTEIKVLLFGMGIGAIALTYGSVLGIEPGLSILLLLVSLKLLETNNVRDFQVTTLLGYFLALCDLFFSQDLLLWLYVAVAFVVLTTALIRFHSGPRGIGYGRATRLAGAMFLQALPLVVILFLFFPRTSGGFRFQFSQSLLNSTGMSNSLSPGSISGAALSEAVAFRAEFPDGQTPSMAAMYWRAMVLWKGDDMNWVVGPELEDEQRMGQLAGPAIRQRISLQPHGEKWLFALDRPASTVRGADYIAGGCLQAVRPVTSKLLYEVISRPENRELRIPRDQRAAALKKPSHISAAVQNLVNAWRASATDDRQVVKEAMNYFRDERFVYTLEPGPYPKEGALDEFLFSRRKGFCEHYAATFATLMRIAGIPSRVVLGYHGGELNQIGKYVIVHQSDAHAWCEVWIRDLGWMRVDPTDMIAPDRLGSDLASYLQAHPADPAAAARISSTMLGWKDLINEALLAWDSVNYEWDLRVLNFDEENQRTFLYALGLRDGQWPQILGGAAVVVAICLALLSLALRRPGRAHADSVARWYARFCRALEVGGVRRQSAEGPVDFGARAAARFPNQAAAIQEITSMYVRLRYAPTPPSSAAFVSAVRALPKLKA